MEEATPPAKPSSPARVVAPRPAKPVGLSCSKCGEVGHNARAYGRAPKGPGGKPIAKVEDSAKARRADIIAKRAGALPTPTASFETEAG